MGHLYLALTTRSVMLVMVLAALVVNTAEQETTTITTVGGGTDTNDTTTPKNSTISSMSTTTTVTTKLPTTTTTTTTTTAKPPGNLRPVGQPCLNLYFNCTGASPEFVKANFCQAFKENVACFNSTIKGCSADEVNRIEYVDCGPNVLGTKNTVPTACQGRVTECLSLSVKPEDLKITTDFKTFFCSKQTKQCLTFKHDNKTVCTEDEYKAALAIAKCTGAHTAISSALFVTLAVLTQRMAFRN